MMKLLCKNHKGFTLIELMIVIAIIGVLAAIAIPNFNRARKNAKAKACLANMRTIETAVETYNIEHLEEVMTSEQGGLDLEVLLPYFGGGRRPRCPEEAFGGEYSFVDLTTVSCAIHSTVGNPTPIDSLP